MTLQSEDMEREVIAEVGAEKGVDSFRGEEMGDTGLPSGDTRESKDF